MSVGDVLTVIDADHAAFLPLGSDDVLTVVDANHAAFLSPGSDDVLTEVDGGHATFQTPVGGAWDPTMLPNLELLLGFGQGFYQDTARTTPATANDDPVAGVADRSTHARHASAVSGSTPPVLKTAAVNGHAGLLMDGVQTILETTSFSVSQPDTIFIVWKENSVNATTRVALRSLTTVQQIWNASNKLNYYASAAQEGITTLGTTPHLVTAIFDGASSELRMDGAVETTDNPGTDGLSGIVDIGGFSTFVIDGYLLGVAICSGVISGTDLSNMESYMADYAGVTLP